jgi:flagellar biosynthesis chaperone FliJ
MKTNTRRTTRLAACILAPLMICPAVAEEVDPFEAESIEVNEMKILEFLEQNLPHMLEPLPELAQKEPEEYREQLKEISEHMHHYYEVKERSPDVADALLRSHRLEHEAEKLAHAIVEGELRGARNEALDKLRGLLNEVFELRLKEAELEVRSLEEELSHIKEIVGRRREARDQIVERHMKGLFSEFDEALEWW